MHDISFPFSYKVKKIRKEFVKKVIKTIAGDTGVYFIKMHIWDKLKKE